MPISMMRVIREDAGSWVISSGAIRRNFRGGMATTGRAAFSLSGLPVGSTSIGLGKRRVWPEHEVETVCDSAGHSTHETHGGGSAVHPKPKLPPKDTHRDVAIDGRALFRKLPEQSMRQGFDGEHGRQCLRSPPRRLWLNLHSSLAHVIEAGAGPRA